jgi:hypothetical protein
MYTLSVAQERNGKTFWTRIGTMFPMKGRDGFNLVFSALPIPALNKEGQLEVRVTAFPPKDDDGPVMDRTRAGKNDDLDSEIPF